MKKKEAIEKILSATNESAAALEKSLARLAPAVADSAAAIASALRRGGKVLICGNGGSAADAQHTAGELVGRFLKEREPYAAIALSTDTSVMTSLANDYGFDTVFQRQVNALGKKGDVLLALSTSGNSKNVLLAMEAARGIGMKIIGMTGKGGGKMAAGADILLDAESSSTPRIQEVHALIIHILCDIVEQTLTEKK